MLKVAVDIDGVCCNFIDEARSLILEKHNFDIFPPLEIGLDHKDYEQSEDYIDSVVYQVITTPTLKVIGDANISLQFLNKVPGIEFQYLTSRYFEHCTDTLAWLEHNDFPHPEKLTFCSDKGKYCAKHNIDYMVEDQLKYIEQILGDSPNTQVLLYDAIYNRQFDEHPRVKRVKNWAQVGFNLMFPKRLKEED